MLEQYPFSSIMSILGIVLVTSFFITSSDSGSLVIDSITSGGKLDAPVGQRIFWALSEGAVAATLLLGGGLAALQTAAITTGLPFTIILFVMCFSLYKGLRQEMDEMDRIQRKKVRQSYEDVIKELLTKQQSSKQKTGL